MNKMKVVILFFAALGLANASVVFHEGRVEVRSDNASLDELLQQFASFIPFDNCKKIVERYIATDADVLQAYEFFNSTEFAILADKVVAMPQYQDFLKYLYDAGLDIYAYQNIIRKMFGLPPIPPPKSYFLNEPTTVPPTEPGVIKMVLEVLNALPLEEIKEWFYDTCLPNPNYQALIVKLRQKEFIDLVIQIEQTPEYQHLKNILKDQGVDVDAIEKAIADFLGSHRSDYVKHHNAPRSPRTLESLLQQFTELFPMNQVLGIVLDYLLDDKDVQAVFAFLKGDDFRNLVVKVEGLQELKDFLAWVKNKHITIYSYLNSVLDILGDPEVHPTSLSRSKNSLLRSGLTNMIDAILKIIPKEQIAAWYYVYCVPDPEFQAFMEYLKSQKFIVIVLAVENDKSYPEMVQGLKNLDVDTDAVGQFLHDTFGW